PSRRPARTSTARPTCSWRSWAWTRWISCRRWRPSCPTTWMRSTRTPATCPRPGPRPAIRTLPSRPVLTRRALSLPAPDLPAPTRPMPGRPAPATRPKLAACQTLTRHHRVPDRRRAMPPGETPAGREVRLQKALAAAGVGSRRACEEMIADGRVTVDGTVATLGDKVDPTTAVIHVDGERVVTNPDLVYLAFNKPRGVVSTMEDEQGRRA